MVLLLHILIALSSVAFSTYLFIRPTKQKLYASYGLIALTFISGTYLVATSHVNMLQTCASGLVYAAAMTLATVLARNKLAAQAQQSSK